MATTTNFGWETPDDTDLVKDGALAMRTLGNAIDASMVDLKGGTTGQILSKNSNTDMDFVWIANDAGDITGVTATSPLTGGGTSGAVTIGIDDATTAQKGAVQLTDSTSSTSTTTAATPNSVKSAYDLANAAIPKSLIDAAGDLIVGTAADTLARLGIGTAGQVLTVNSGATAPEWKTISSGGGLTLLSTTSLSSNSTTISSISGSYKWLWIVLKGVFLAVDGEEVRMRMNGDTSTTKYISTGIQNSNTTVTGVSVRSSYIPIVKAPDQTYTAYQYANAEILVPRYTDTDAVWSYINGHGYNGSGATTIMFKGSGVYDCSAAISSVTFYTSGASNFDGGTVYIYGVS